MVNKFVSFVPVFSEVESLTQKKGKKTEIFLKTRISAKTENAYV
jgi:hypothetical protein